MERTQIEQVRRFNRAVTERVGALNDRYLGRDRPFGQARLLWEIGDGGRTVRQLRERCGLDSGYVSRLLRALQADGLVTIERQSIDRRVRAVRLTDAGLAERAVLDERSNELADALLERLDAAQRTRLVTAMGEVERLLTAASVTVADAAPDDPAAQHCLRSYAAELAEVFDTGFDPARTLLPDPGELCPPRGLFLAAWLNGEAVGCAGLKMPSDAPAEIKRMWIAPRARGLGLARRLLREVEARAAQHGREVLRLDTNRALTAAIGLYRSYGFKEVAPFNDEPYAHHWFEKRVAAPST